jgi:hypothetical protein
MLVLFFPSTLKFKSESDTHLAEQHKQVLCDGILQVVLPLHTIPRPVLLN